MTIITEKAEVLSQTQRKVMIWMSQKWTCRLSHGDVAEINGKRVCTLATLKALERKGLIEKKPDLNCWIATQKGRSAVYKPQTQFRV